MRPRPARPTLVLVAAGAALAGCASTPLSTAVTTHDAAASGATYADGSYEATGRYQSPAGQEQIDVQLTLSGGTVTSVTVTPQATDPEALQFEQLFAGGISDAAVGKSIDTLRVDRVAGSSLTSGGFNAALDDIKQQAKQ